MPREMATVVEKGHLGDETPTRADLRYWLGQPVAARRACVETLRRQVYGDHPDFEELLRLFARFRVDHVIVGGYALAFHGAPRLTGDLGILVSPAPENARRTMTALTEFGFGGSSLTATDFTQPGRLIRLGHPPVRVDMLTSVSGVSWEQVFANRVAGTLGGVPVSFIGHSEFLANKRASGRARDLADIEALGGA